MSTKHETIIKDKLNSFNIYTDFTTTPHSCGYDLENNDYICEVKWRTQHYEDQIFEEEKLHKNLKVGMDTGRDFIYIVRTTKGCYAWNITEMLRHGHKFEWFLKSLPKTSEFSDRHWVKKSIATLYYSDAKEFKLETGND